MFCRTDTALRVLSEGFIPSDPIDCHIQYEFNQKQQRIKDSRLELDSGGRPNAPIEQEHQPHRNVFFESFS